MPLPRFFAPDVPPPGGRLSLPPDEAHHARHVLRLAAGAEVALFDGKGREWTARIVGVTRAAVTVDVLAEAVPVAEPSVEVTLAVGLLKGDQMDAVVRDATMLGVSAVVPMATAHVAAPRRGNRSQSAERWVRVAVASAKQCRRAVVPAIAPVTPLPDVIARDDFELKVMCVEPARAAAGPLAGLPAAPPATVLVLIGPEGGWSTAEVDLAAQCGARLIHLGPRTLRAEVAPVVALSALWATWGW